MAQSRFLDKFLTWFANTTDAPFEFGTVAGLSALSTIALGRRWLEYTEPLHANIFGMIVGDSGIARKSTALRRAQLLIEQVEPDRIGPNDYTSESLFQWMRDNKGSNGKGRQKLTLYATELGSDLARMSAYATTMKADFCNLYDCVPIHKTRMGKSVDIPDPRVSFLGACAYQMMVANLSHNDWATGYLMRFLYVAPINMRQTFTLPPDPQVRLHQNAQNALQTIRDQLFGTKYGMRLSGGAKGLYARSMTYHTYFMQQGGDIVRTYAGRFWTNILKLALLYQLDEDPSAIEISEEAMRRAVQFGMEICWPSFIVAFEKTAVTTFNNLAMIVGAIIAEAGDKGIFRSTIAHRFMGRRELTDVLNWFKLNRIVRVTTQLKMGGGMDELMIWEK